MSGDIDRRFDGEWDTVQRANVFSAADCFLGFTGLSQHEVGLPVDEYVQFRIQALDAIERGDAAAAFLLRAPRMAEVEGACLAGQTMPQKSTYFFPKLLSGLVFHLLDADA